MIDLTNKIGIYEERMVPWLVRQDLYASHLIRYKWVNKYLSGRILDAGCSIGYGLEIISKNAKDIIGIELSKDIALFGKKKFKKDIINADVREIPFIDQSFDTVISFEVLEHIANQNDFLKEVVRVTNKNNGKFIVSTPWLRTNNWQNPHHVKELSLTDFQNLLKEYFNKIQLYTQRQKNSITAKILRRINFFNPYFNVYFVPLIYKFTYEIVPIEFANNDDIIIIAVCEF